ncbi:surface layer-associated protease precursor [Aeropyrum pernix K1]|uniref:Surface layer-associated protease n=1 Tax=Aeropyrum pernix (strain ATCC 700893 / DSM 11879 / JCM 9820 / NBRC 100138 / K1) TaxID=272557 RepID=Q9YEG9_AERPE|nr:S8 family serine peptidase [Aeropyrum pernix]BAA79577.1 surface layer-associated protease precursor [Aeropyrum pernix K1]
MHTPRISGLAVRLAAALLILIMLLPLAPSYTPSAAPPTPEYKAYVDPVLLNPEGYDMPVDVAYTPELSSLIAKLREQRLASGLEPLREGQAKVTIIYLGGNPEEVAGLTEGVIFGLNMGGKWVIEAWADRESVEALASLEGVAAILKSRSPVSSILREVELLEKLQPEPGVEPTLYAAVDAIGASRVWEEFGVTGEGVKVAVVDTGVDYGHSDLGVESIARAEDGTPLIFDADQLGFALTLSEAVKDEEGYVNVSTPVPFIDLFFMGYGEAEAGWLLYISPDGTVAYYEFPIDRFFVGDIESAGGVFKFGLAVQTVFILYGSLGILNYSLPVLLADGDGDGSYETVYADLSTAYYLFLKALSDTGMISGEPDPSLLDLSFADETPASYGSEVLARDFTGDGVNDFSAGALAGWTYDWVGLLTGESVNLGWRLGFDYAGLVLPGLDPQGRWVSILYDTLAHGTSVATVIASRGNVEFNLGYIETSLRGVAPGAKIAAGGSFLINVFVAQLFLSGFEPQDSPLNWVYTGEHQVDVINNSWGNSYIALRGFLTGADDYATIEDYIVSASGTVIVHAMGNGGPGYGTATTPGAGSLIISVGASTLFDYRPFYGYLPSPGGDVISWSDRGPSQIGVAKPDVVNIGSFAWAGVPVLTGLGNGSLAFDIFGGTSEATPMTSGSVALVISAYQQAFGAKPSPGLVKAILKSTARDTGADAFTQGSGQVDVYRAVKAVLEGGVPIALSTSVYENVYSLLSGYSYPFLAPNPVEDTQIYPGVLKPGETAVETLVLKTLSGEAEVSDVKAYTFHVVRKGLLEYLDLENAYVILADGSTVPLQERLAGVGEDGSTLTLLLQGDERRIIVPMKQEYLQGLAKPLEYENEIIVSFPYTIMDPGRTYGPSPGVPYLILGAEFHLGFDLDGDGVITLGETARVNYDIRYANTLHVEIGNPESQAAEVAEWLTGRWGIEVSPEDAVPVLDLRILFNVYGLIGQQLELPLKLETEFLHRFPACGLSVSLSSTTVTPEGVEAEVAIQVPEDAAPGVYQYYIEIAYSDGGKTLVPVSVPVAAVVDSETGVLDFGGFVEEAPYRQYAVSGKFDWSWRYESGDWRTFPVVFEDPSVKAVVVAVEWQSPDTAIDVAVGGPGYNFLAADTEEDIAYLYGSVVAAKMAYHGGALGRSGLVPYYETPSKTKSIVLAPVAEAGKPYWVVVRNSIIDASTVFPETFTVELRPVRVTAEVLGELQEGEEVTVRFTITGTALISYAQVYTSVEGATVTPSTLGFGLTHVVEVTFTYQGEEEVSIALLTPLARSYDIGFDYGPYKFAIFRVPGFFTATAPLS